MKFLALLIICLGLVSILKQRPRPQLSDDACSAILDSTEIMAQTGLVTLRGQKTETNPDKFLRVSKWLEHRSFQEFKCLLGSSNALYRLYGYMYAGMQYLDSLEQDYSFILKDTTVLFSITEKGIVDSHLTIGDFLKKVHDGIVEDNKNWAKRPLMESKVKEFIKEYANYPSTYQPTDFPFFSMGSETGEGLTDYRLRHVYSLQNNHGQKVKVMSEFVFDPELNIRIIAKDSTNLYSVSKPYVSEWFEEFGRPLKAADSIALLLK